MHFIITGGAFLSGFSKDLADLVSKISLEYESRHISDEESQYYTPNEIRTEGSWNHELSLTVINESLTTLSIIFQVDTPKPQTLGCWELGTHTHYCVVYFLLSSMV